MVPTDESNRLSLPPVHHVNRICNLLRKPVPIIFGWTCEKQINCVVYEHNTQNGTFDHSWAQTSNHLVTDLIPMITSSSYYFKVKKKSVIQNPFFINTYHGKSQAI